VERPEIIIIMKKKPNGQEDQTYGPRDKIEGDENQTQGRKNSGPKAPETPKAKVTKAKTQGCPAVFKTQDPHRG